jgi:aminoacrylate hydrolase
MPIASLPDADIYYETHGSGPPVMLIAGLGGAGTYWEPNIAALAQHHTVILHDHRGTGRSSRPETPYSVELLCDDMTALMDIIGIGRAALIGHSTGGAMAQIFAARAPARVERLLLYASWARLCPQMALCLKTRQQILRLGGTLAYHRASQIFLYPPRFVRDAWPRLEQEIAAAERGSTTLSILDARLEAIMAFDGTPYLDAIAAPTTVLVAADDILTPPYASEALAAGIRGARLHVLPYGAHALSRCEPDIFNRFALSSLQAQARSQL